MIFTKYNLFTRAETINWRVITRSISVHAKLVNYMENDIHLRDLIEQIPEQYLGLKRANGIENLYVIDWRIARSMCTHAIPSLRGRQVIADCSPGLGLIARELLKNRQRKLRLYEYCPDLRVNLEKLQADYPDRIELFSKNILCLARLSAQDKYDNNNRVTSLLRGIQKRTWAGPPFMTLIGSMPNLSFITYLIWMQAMQAEINVFGRVELFVAMRPSDYLKLVAGPHNNLHTYQQISILFNTLFKIKLLEKYPRQAFIPWETRKKISYHTRWHHTIDTDLLYYVHIVQKRTLPLSTEQILPFFFFIKQLCRGTNHIIPTVEKWVPGCGKRLILPSKSSKYYNDMNIYTKFGDLTPEEILAVFHEMIQHEGFNQSSFLSMIQTELIKYETRENDTSLLLEDSFDEDEFENKLE